jgi:hypothetical protein
VVAAKSSQAVDQRVGFDSFSDHAEAEPVGQVDHRVRDRFILALVEHPADHAAIQLQRADGQRAQERQTRATRAEVVDGDLDPAGLQLAQPRSWRRRAGLKTLKSAVIDIGE